MTIGNTARLTAARSLMGRFRDAGRGRDSSATAALQRSPAGWSISRDALASQIDGRLAGTNTPAQVATSYCGPAAFLYCLLEDRPDIYVSYAISLWLRGSYDFHTAGGHVDVDATPTTIGSMSQIQNTEKKASAGHAGISELDWMTMASLSASTRPWFAGGHSAKPDQEFKSITYPWVMKRWFAAGGSRPVVNSMGLGALKTGLLDFVNIMRFWPQHWLVLQIDSTLITGGAPDTLHNRHWVVVDPHRPPRARRGGSGNVVPLGEITKDIFNVPKEQADIAMTGKHLSAWPMDVRLVTWGQENYRTRLSTLGDVSDRFYGGFAFPRFR